MSHGFRGSSTGPARTFVDFARKLVTEGYSTLRFDQPNSANSEGDYVDSSFKEWVDTITFLSSKYLKEGYKVGLLGQSMGATATIIAANKRELFNKIPCVILWVPDPETDFKKDPNQISEEGGQKYKNSFWQEAKEMDFFGCLDKYQGGIHLVYGENDHFVSQDLRNETIKRVQQKDQPVLILPGQEHSPWTFDSAQRVYKEEIEFLKKHL